MPSFEQNKTSKLWSCRFREITPEGEKNKRLSGFKTLREAKAGYFEYQKQREDEEKKKAAEPDSTASHMLFSDMSEKYLEYKKMRLKASSFYDTKNKIEKHLLPFFGDKYFDEIRPSDIMNWQSTLDSEGYSYSHKSTLRTYLVSIYDFAERYYDAKDIMKKVEPFRNTEPVKHMDFWTRAEFDAFLEQLADDTLVMLFRTLYISGCRKGEALALSPADFDFAENTIRICKSITRKTVGKPFEVTTPKNKSSDRTVDMPDKYMRDMREFLDKITAENGGEEPEFVFGGDRPIAEQTLTRRFNEAAARAGVKKIRIHDLRHSCASMLISEGVSIVAVSHRLGHKNVEQTLNTYSHLMPKDSERILSAFADV